MRLLSSMRAKVIALLIMAGLVATAITVPIAVHASGGALPPPPPPATTGTKITTPPKPTGNSTKATKPAPAPQNKPCRVDFTQVP
ncbi:MAG: hypothetical protein J2P36_07625 [Ktedonobacteraceae bacterium]|nr:hypothetical protein [Ktedonobacteraceae bacterium]